MPIQIIKGLLSVPNPHLNYFRIIKNYPMNLSLILFLIGILGFVLNRKNIILMLISIEIMLLSITFLILINSFSFDDILGQTLCYIYNSNSWSRISNRFRYFSGIL